MTLDIMLRSQTQRQKLYKLKFDHWLPGKTADYINNLKEAYEVIEILLVVLAELWLISINFAICKLCIKTDLGGYSHYITRHTNWCN